MRHASIQLPRRAEQRRKGRERPGTPPGTVVVHADASPSRVRVRVFLMHLDGKLEVISRVPIKNRDDLSMAYTPGGARVCRAIFEDPDRHTH